MNRRKRVLITGGAGFLGSHLCERYLKTGCDVFCVDNLLTGSLKNLHDFSNYSHFKFIRHDILSPLHLKTDEIFNLACPASPIHYQADPVQTTKINVMGSVNMLDLALETGAKIFQASTSEIYGNPMVHPQHESYWGNVNTFGPRSCYDEGKRCVETFFFHYHHQYDLDIRIARIFNTYGPRMQLNDGRVIGNFIVQALRGEDITVNGDGTQTRSFCYVNDLIEGVISLMNTTNGTVGPVNLGNPTEYPIIELAKIIINMTKSTSRITFRPLPENDPVRRRPDITAAKTKLGWEPKTTLEKGLKITIDYFKKLLGMN